MTGDAAPAMHGAICCKKKQYIGKRCRPRESAHAALGDRKEGGLNYYTDPNYFVAEYIAGRDPVSGSVYVAMLLLFALMPLILARRSG